jgi:isocitrate lyase
MSSRELDAQKLQKDWSESPRWRGIKRGYSADDVVRLRGSTPVEYSLARRGADKLWRLLHEEPFVNSLGALGHTQYAFLHYPLLDTP